MAEGDIRHRAPPREYEALRSDVMALRDTLPKRLAQAAQYAVAHPDEIALGTTASIANASGVQPSTLVRLARHLGYDGFSDLQAVFRERLRNRASSYEERLEKIEKSSGDGYHETELLNGFIAAARQSVDTLGRTLKSEDFSNAVATLARAETIYLIARRRAYPVVAHMAYAFGKLKIKSLVLDSPNAIDEDLAGLVGERDAALACSFAPYTANTVELARAIAARGAPVVAITDSGFSPLARIATHMLEVSENDYAGFRSLSASMALATALPVAIAERRRLGDQIVLK
jgi:DNA-binding MurR/RpiR family transcriptional regulator